jgi:hydrogenase maturation protein HypF
MADNGLKNQKVIGVACDGTGLGSDNRLWGAEFLICDYKDFIRAGHLKEIPLLGAERAILEPWRLAAWWLYSIYKDKFLNLKINFVKGVNKKHWRTLKNMYLSGFNSPASSSMGRLFDAAASLVLAKYKADFQAALAMELEKVAAAYRSQVLGLESQVLAYPFRIMQQEGKFSIDPLPMFRQIVLGLKAKEPKGKIAYRIHFTVAEMLKKSCLLLQKKTGIKRVVLSGGVFQNILLLRLSLDLLYKEGLEVFTHKDIACSDSGIALGQALIAAIRSK